jgi:hypothetical protein
MNPSVVVSRLVLLLLYADTADPGCCDCVGCVSRSRLLNPPVYRDRKLTIVG